MDGLGLLIRIVNDIVVLFVCLFVCSLLLFLFCFCCVFFLFLFFLGGGGVFSLPDL